MKTPKPLKISTYAFRKDLKSYLAKALKGREIEITRYGKTVAKLTPAPRA